MRDNREFRSDRGLGKIASADELVSGLELHYGLKSDIAPCPKSANIGHSSLQGSIANKFTRRIHGFGRAGGGRGTGVEPSPGSPWSKERGPTKSG